MALGALAENDGLRAKPLGSALFSVLLKLELDLVTRPATQSLLIG
jgi:hypothetical protein